MPPRFEITEAEIDFVVARFYARVRVHPVLAPIFAVHVEDWPAHEAKIARFWKGAILFQPGYEGSPMMAHRRAQNVEAAHFPQWLAAFDDVVKVTVFLRDLDHYAAVNAVYEEYFATARPARAAVQVARLPKDVDIEIECIAAR